MWLDNLKELKAEIGITAKQIAEKENMPERTVTRIFSGDTESPRMDQIIKIAHALGASLDDIFADTQAVVGRSSLAALQEENEKLKSKVASLISENDLLKLKLDHKDEIIALHTYYMNKSKASE